MNPTMPRKKPSQARSRAMVEAILVAAGQVLAAEGPARATTDRIAQRAGVSVGSLYQYFPNKEAVFAELLRRGRGVIFAEISEHLVTLADAALEEVACVCAEALLAPFREQPRIALALAQHRDFLVGPDERRASQRPLWQLLAAQLRERADVRPMAHPELTALAMVKAAEGLILDALCEMPERLHDGSLSVEIQRLLLAFLRQPEGGGPR